MNKNLVAIIVTVVGSVLLIGLLVMARGDKPGARERELIELAESVGLDTDKFLEDYRSEEVRNKVAEDLNYAEDVLADGGVSTPSIIIDGERIVTPPADADEFENLINDYLAEYEGEGAMVVEVFEDYQCPYCGLFFTIPFLTEARFDAEDVEFRHIHTPLKTIHPLAESYAWAAEAANKQDKFLEMSRAIFQKVNPANDYSALDELMGIETDSDGASGTVEEGSGEDAGAAE